MLEYMERDKCLIDVLLIIKPYSAHRENICQVHEKGNIELTLLIKLSTYFIICKVLMPCLSAIELLTELSALEINFTYLFFIYVILLILRVDF